MRAAACSFLVAILCAAGAPAPAGAGEIDPLARARSFAKRSQYDQAEKVLSRALRDEVRDARAASELLGFCLMRLFRFDEACDAFAAGDPQDRYHFVNYGYCLLKAGRVPEAREAFAAGEAALPPADTWAIYCRTKLQELAPIAGKRVVLGLAQADDHVVALLNGKPCARARAAGEAAVALDDLLVPGKNELCILAVNTKDAWSYRARLTIDGREAFAAAAGRASPGAGAFEDDRTIGVVGEFALELVVAEDRSTALAATRTAVDFGDALARLRAAEDLWEAGKRADAIARLEEAGKRYPLLDVFPRRIAELHEALAADLPLSAESAAARGRARAAAAEARERWLEVRRKVAALVPDDPGALFALATASREVGRHADAEKAYRRLVALDPNSAEAYVGLAEALVRLGRAKEALAFADEAIVREPGWWEAHYARGDALLAAGDVPGALAALTRALEADPRQIEWIQAKMAVAANHGGANAAAIAAARADAEKRPDDALAQKSLGDALLRGMQWEEARRAYGRATELAPDFPGAWPLAGIAAELSGAVEDAEAAYRRTPREDPLIELARRRVARIKFFRAAAAAAPKGGPPAPGAVPIDFASSEKDEKARCVAAIEALGKVRPILAAGLRVLPPLRDGEITADEAKAVECIRALAIRARANAESRLAFALIERQIGPRAGKSIEIDGKADDWIAADRIARDARGDGDGGGGELVEGFARIDGADLVIAWRCARPAAPSRERAFWAHVYPSERGSPWWGIGLAGGEPLLVQTAALDKKRTERGAATGIVWRAGEIVEARVPLARVGGDRRCRVELYTWSDEKKGRLDTIAGRGGRPPNIDDGYSPALLALFELARELEFEPEDRVALAIALASADFYALGDRRLQAVVAEDDRRMLKLARALKTWQRAQGLPSLSAQPLSALLFWADRAGQWRPRDLASYRRETVSPATLEAMFRYAKERGWRSPSVPDLIDRIERHLRDPLRWQYTSAEAAARGARVERGESGALAPEERRELAKFVRDAFVDGRKVSTDGGFAADIQFDYLVAADALVGHCGSHAQATVEFARALGIPGAIVQGIEERSRLFRNPHAFAAYWDGAVPGWRSLQGRRYQGGRPVTLFWFLPGAATPAGARRTSGGGYWFPVRTTYGAAGEEFERGAALPWWDARLRELAAEAKAK